MDENKENEVNNVESEVNQSTNTTATNDKKGFSIAGIITGVIGMILSIVLVVSIVLLSVSIFNSTKDAIDNSNYPSSYYYYND